VITRLVLSVLLASSLPAGAQGISGRYELEMKAPSNRMRMTLECSLPRICTLTAESQEGTEKPEVSVQYVEKRPLKSLREADSAWQYAIKHKDAAPSGRPDDTALMPLLKPMLAAEIGLEACWDLYQRDEGYMAACTLNRDPWRRDTVLLMGTLLANCSPPFCRYIPHPLKKAAAPPAPRAPAANPDALRFVKAEKLPRGIDELISRIAANTELFKSYARRVGEAAAQDKLKKEAARLAPKYEVPWAAHYAAGLSERLSKEELASIAKEGNDSRHIMKLMDASEGASEKAHVALGRQFVELVAATLDAVVAP
jgi:hypothetical protein